MVETLDNQLNEPSNQNLIKLTKFVGTTNKKTLNKTLGTSALNSTLMWKHEISTHHYTPELKAKITCK